MDLEGQWNNSAHRSYSLTPLLANILTLAFLIRQNFGLQHETQNIPYGLIASLSDSLCLVYYVIECKLLGGCILTF